MKLSIKLDPSAASALRSSSTPTPDSGAPADPSGLGVSKVEGLKELEGFGDLVTLSMPQEVVIKDEHVGVEVVGEVDTSEVFADSGPTCELGEEGGEQEDEDEPVVLVNLTKLFGLSKSEENDEFTEEEKRQVRLFWDLFCSEHIITHTPQPLLLSATHALSYPHLFPPLLPSLLPPSSQPSVPKSQPPLVHLQPSTCVSPSYTQ